MKTKIAERRRRGLTEKDRSLFYRHLIFLKFLLKSHVPIVVQQLRKHQNKIFQVRFLMNSINAEKGKKFKEEEKME